MENRTDISEHVRVFLDPLSAPLSTDSTRITRLIVQRGTAEPRKVTVKPNAGGHFELKGLVDSQWEHDIVLTMVQTSLQSWRLIDRVTVAG